METAQQSLRAHQSRLKGCQRCSDMTGPVVVGEPAISDVIQIGQAPGPREGEFGKPFAWTAGKTLFGWYRQIGVDEETFRQRVYMAAVCRCFPGKNPKGGDRVPSEREVQNCSTWFAEEVRLLQPKLLIPVGKLAVSQFLSFKRLVEVIGKPHHVNVHGVDVDLIPLPHPSGLSTWHRVEPGKTLLHDALSLIADHPVWQKTFSESTD